MAMLLLRTGDAKLAERWLNSALSLDAAYRPAHAALADLYDQQGQKDLAAEHRRQASPEAGDKP